MQRSSTSNWQICFLFLELPLLAGSVLFEIPAATRNLMLIEIAFFSSCFGFPNYAHLITISNLKYYNLYILLFV
ncbi:hypothetical protein OPV22_030798 [Ensete ventricosum]|uniref:NADH:quinone oxidoreductase/Mrp antiporter membrane subunit domain-containing protein n=1 Tax=Ensete ventricosum TaxID=4639 RepID=A0AAV8PRS3_ENSVE|nr:hypothetical protein OPV22_030798 [Ensete ventricosum]